MWCGVPDRKCGWCGVEYCDHRSGTCSYAEFMIIMCLVIRVVGFSVRKTDEMLTRAV